MKESCFKTTLILDALYKFYQRGFGSLLIFDSTEKNTRPSIINQLFKE